MSEYHLRQAAGPESTTICDLAGTCTRMDHCVFELEHFRCPCEIGTHDLFRPAGHLHVEIKSQSDTGASSQEVKELAETA